MRFSLHALRHWTGCSSGVLSRCRSQFESCGTAHQLAGVWPHIRRKQSGTASHITGSFKNQTATCGLGKPIIESLRTTDLGERCFDIGIPLLVCHGTSDNRPPSQSHTPSEALAKSQAHRPASASSKGASHSFRPSERHWHELSDFVRVWLHSVPLAQPVFKAGNHGANVSAVRA